jgi:hypothetical protein
VVNNFAARRTEAAEQDGAWFDSSDVAIDE